MKPRIQWGRLLRRSLALFLATLAVWALLVCSGGGSAANAFRSLGQDPGFVSAALSAELGQVAEDDGPLSGLSGWARLVVDQSPLLRGNGDAVAGHLDGSAPATPDLPAGQPAQDHDDISEPPPETTAAPEDIIARTLVPTSTQGYEFADGVYLYNRTKLTVDLAAAVAEPVADKRIVGCIKSMAQGGVLYLKLVCYGIVLFFATIALQTAAVTSHA